MGSRNSKNKELIYSNITVADNGCWIWQKYCTPSAVGGHGIVGVQRKLYKAHRIAYEIFKDDFDKTLCVLHHCDNPPCVNPDHLFQGTQKDNVADMDQKGRRVPPTSLTSHKSKLNWQIVEDIRTNNLSVKENASKYGVSISTIYLIRQGKTWKINGA
jgi:hypothetical protein